MVQAPRQPGAAAGRDLPGSNWHFYPPDPDGHINELYYGIEQIGWDGYSKPKLSWVAVRQAAAAASSIRVRRSPGGAAEGVDIRSGVRAEEADETFDVGGVLMARPFKITRIGPIRLFVRPRRGAALLPGGARLHADRGDELPRASLPPPGSTPSTTRLRLPPLLRSGLDLPESTSLMSFGLQLANYRQLRDAIAPQRAGVRIRYPPELSPGIDYSFFAIDPDGHAMQLYYYMEQIGWDGKPRPAHLRPRSTTRTGRRPFAGERHVQRRGLPRAWS